jgi:hypothetical protein
VAAEIEAIETEAEVEEVLPIDASIVEKVDTGKCSSVSLQVYLVSPIRARDCPDEGGRFVHFIYSIFLHSEFASTHE